ncbi:oleate hydratase [Aspergillus homomorphus CBS 101889]|uniref:67 kDa myosin-cross-reactive antigen family protein n=1 Tax=Aspergillus homomorphus (strain CBS 101889) TaxID=1450537 RepID=A0A395IE89_ASPHC|nr:67 kDa myosin-cross-reactive antigen family protein [Aspergillus homomorphus CBS 101889]RAL17483.1 67 kDa myosin-cross-reactive antigen family protein [Aspergillus homomorphus CBS 101889]
MDPKSDVFRQDPRNIQAWLVGHGLASLVAAVYLIREGNIPGVNIHIFDLHPDRGGEMVVSGNADEGYSLPFYCLPYLHGEGVKELLDLVPDIKHPGKTLADDVREFRFQLPRAQKHAGPRAVSVDASGNQAVLTKGKGIQLGLKDRMEVIKFIVSPEQPLHAKRIDEVFEKPFFDTGFWSLWSTTFSFQPWHSAAEFWRHLRKYLEEIQTLHEVDKCTQTRFNLFESLVLPITAFLKHEQVDFRYHAEVKDIKFYPDSDPTTVSEIAVTEDERDHLIDLDPQDLCLIDIGFSRSGAVMGSNERAPPFLSSNWEDSLLREWRLWQTLADKSPKFGSPTTFLSRPLESGLETFTTTIRGPAFMNLYDKLTHDQTGTGTLLSLAQSNWALTLSVPHQALFASQPDNVTVLCGSALRPAEEGNFVKKPMFACSGREIFAEVLAHLRFPAEPILEDSATIPCGMPLGTAPFLTRGPADRPLVIPRDTTNVALLGQFAELPDGDTTMSLDYSVRTAQVAVAKLLGLSRQPVSVKKNLLLEVLDLLI